MSRIASKSDLIPGLIDDVDIFRIKPSRVPLRSQLTNIEQLAQSIKERGLLQPIVVRADNNGSFEIVAGNRRFNACKSLGWRKIPCHMVELDDKDAFEISLIENIQRKTLNSVEEAEAFRKYVSDFGYGGISDLARKIGKSPAYVTRKIKLLNLPEDILDAIQKSIISKSAAEDLCSLDDGAKQSKLGEIIRLRHLSLRDTRKLIKSNEASDTGVSYQMDRTSGTEKHQKAFDKPIIVLQSAMSKFGATIDNLEDNWILYEILMQHKNTLHSQIDLLLRQRKKFALCM
ncbi:MAG: ParB family chromosome partitioning protein [Candidatus Nitrosomirales archaeon]|jgi:ParB family chromosome partitioning protein